MTINPQTLRKLRQKKGMTQEVLAKEARISKKTIARIEAGKVKPNSNSSRQIARALKVQENDLAKDNFDREELLREVEGDKYRRIGAYAGRQTDLAFQLVERRYGMPSEAQIRMAPMFAALLAQASLKWRRDNLAALESARGQIESRCLGPLSLALQARHASEGTDTIGEIAGIESRSIEAGDINGEIYSRSLGVSDVSPFEDFIRDLADHFEAELDEFFGGPIAFDYMGFPEYQIAEFSTTPLAFKEVEAGSAADRKFPGTDAASQGRE